jgi:hypothetical protein
VTKYRVFRCPTCKRRRRIFREGVVVDGGHEYRIWRCSQGHTWSQKIGLMEAAESVFKTLYAPPIAEQLGESALFRLLEKR